MTACAGSLDDVEDVVQVSERRGRPRWAPLDLVAVQAARPARPTMR